MCAYSCAHTCVHAPVHVHIDACTCMRTHVCTYMCTYVCVHICGWYVYKNIYIGMCTCMRICVHIHEYMNECVHIHVYIIINVVGMYTRIQIRRIHIICMYTQHEPECCVGFAQLLLGNTPNSTPTMPSILKRSNAILQDGAKTQESIVLHGCTLSGCYGLLFLLATVFEANVVPGRVLYVNVVLVLVLLRSTFRCVRSGSFRKLKFTLCTCVRSVASAFV